MGLSESKVYHIVAKAPSDPNPYMFYWPLVNFSGYCTNELAAQTAFDRSIKENPKMSYQLVWYMPLKDSLGRVRGITGEAHIIREHYGQTNSQPVKGEDYEVL
jgi:hypothetical protein